MQNSITQNQIPKTSALKSAPYATAPQITAPLPQLSAANPNYAGVNIQIFNPMVGTPDGSVYPARTGSAYAPGVQGGCYPPNYYTGQYPQFIPQYPYGQPEQSMQTGYYDGNGIFHPYGSSEQAGQNVQTGGYNKNDTGNRQDGINGSDEKIATVNGQKGYYDKYGIFHPIVEDVSKNAGSAETGARDSSLSETNNITSDGKDGADGKDAGTAAQNVKKTEKRSIVELTDDYIKTLENYLNSQDAEVRLMGAKEVVNRLTEDDSRKDDPALTALVNKMLQDPSSAIRATALSLIDSRTVSGDDYTVNLLKKMQNSQDGFGQDAIQATSALLKMAGKPVEKEFEVKNTAQKNEK